MPAALRMTPRCLAAGVRPRAARGFAAGVALLAAMATLSACVSVPVASASDPAPYRGSWAYAQSCGLAHSARLDLHVATDGSVHGEWSDGTRVAGDSGRLAGRIRDGRLDLRLCPATGDCPPPSAAADAHLRREGAMLVWYRRFGGDDGQAADGSAPRASASHERYLSLHPVVGEADPPFDTDCKDDPETL